MSDNQAVNEAIPEKRPRSESGSAASDDASILDSKRPRGSTGEETDESHPTYTIDDQTNSGIGGSAVITTDSITESPFFHEDDLTPWSYEDQVIAAPMVRVSTLPFRLVCKSFGCQMMYSEEIVAKKLAKCARFESPNGLISFAPRDRNTGSVVRNQQLSETLAAFDPEAEAEHFNRTYPSTAAAPNESNATLVTYPHERLVLQLGASSGVDAVAAAQVACRDVRAVDLNMGCPKLFSLQDAMGAALLSRPEQVEDIIKSLKRALTIPVTAKIRMLPDPRDTVELVRRLESMGVAAVGVHCRFKEDRPRFRALPGAQMPLLVSSARVPLLYNGDVFTWDEVDQYRAATGASSVLIARGALWNPSIFGGDGRGLWSRPGRPERDPADFSAFYGSAGAEVYASTSPIAWQGYREALLAPRPARRRPAPLACAALRTPAPHPPRTPRAGPSPTTASSRGTGAAPTRRGPGLRRPRPTCTLYSSAPSCSPASRMPWATRCPTPSTRC
jgi:tRNA-dihydrouridine synthase 2